MPILTSKMDDANSFIEKNGLGKVIRLFTDKEIFKLMISMLNKNYKLEVKSNYDIKYDEISLLFSWNRRFSKISKKLNEVMK